MAIEIHRDDPLPPRIRRIRHSETNLEFVATDTMTEPYLAVQIGGLGRFGRLSPAEAEGLGSALSGWAARVGMDA